MATSGENPTDRKGIDEDIVRAVLEEVLEERRRQEAKWGRQDHHPSGWNSILGEEDGEVDKAVNESDWSGYRTELIQVAAVAVAAVESFDRNGPPRKTAWELLMRNGEGGT